MVKQPTLFDTPKEETPKTELVNPLWDIIDRFDDIYLKIVDKVDDEWYNQTKNGRTPKQVIWDGDKEEIDNLLESI